MSAWIAAIRYPMSSVARAVSWDSSLTSLATTAKPLPSSPARAASMVALSAGARPSVAASAHHESTT